MAEEEVKHDMRRKVLCSARAGEEYRPRRRRSQEAMAVMAQEQLCSVKSYLQDVQFKNTG